MSVLELIRVFIQTPQSRRKIDILAQIPRSVREARWWRVMVWAFFFLITCGQEKIDSFQHFKVLLYFNKRRNSDNNDSELTFMCLIRLMDF